MSLKVLSVYEILVPKFSPAGDHLIPTEYHEEWDKKVLKICGGLTLREINAGKWMGQNGETYKEDMIVVRIACDKTQMIEIMEFTKLHYNQQAVFAIMVSEVAFLLE